MVVAPLLSVLLSNVDFDLFGIHFDNLNSVGWVLCNRFSLILAQASLAHSFLICRLLLVLLNMIPQVMVWLLKWYIFKTSASSINVNILLSLQICLYLPDIDTPTKNSEGDENDKDEWSMMFGSIIKNPHIAVPFLTIFVFNFNWQLIETGGYRLLLLLTIYYWSIVQLNSLSTHSSGTKCSGCFGFGK